MTAQRWLWSSLVFVGTVGVLAAQTAKPTFEVVSVRRNVSFLAPRFDFQQARLVVTNVPLRWLIAVAYAKDGREPNPNRIVGGPAWIDSAAFDIQATTGGNPTSKTTMMLMLRTLLEERFGLHTHAEQRNAPAYALLLNRADGRLGPRLTPAGQLGPQLRPEESKICADLALEEARERRCGWGVYFDTKEEVTVVYASDADIDGLIDHIFGPVGAALDRPVIDRTNLSGRFDYELRFSIEAGRVSTSPALGPNPSGTPVFTALREQLGLRLDSVTAPTDVLVIDSVQQPTEN